MEETMKKILVFVAGIIGLVIGAAGRATHRT